MVNPESGQSNYFQVNTQSPFEGVRNSLVYDALSLRVSIDDDIVGTDSIRFGLVPKHSAGVDPARRRRGRAPGHSPTSRLRFRPLLAVADRRDRPRYRGPSRARALSGR